jgi:xanthine dehydrogenase accessory factor
VLVMTHDHAEDAALIDAALRTDHLGSIGLIGSSAKWTRSARSSWTTGTSRCAGAGDDSDRPARS